MAGVPVAFTLSYSGSSADANEIDFYDVSLALVGFQRSLALTTHLILNGEVITQAPALKGASIVALPPAAGSWKLSAAVVLAGGIFTVGTAPRDTPLGNLISSAYDFVISETLGFHVDYDKTLGLQYEELKKQGSDIKPQPQSKYDAVIEKCEVAIENMHRPIVWSETASQAKIIAAVGKTQQPFEHALDRATYDYIHFTDRENQARNYVGRISSYNVNTYKGRVYVHAELRPVPFELGPSARSPKSINRVIGSLAANAERRTGGHGDISFEAIANRSRTGRLKSLWIVRVIEDEKDGGQT